MCRLRVDAQTDLLVFSRELDHDPLLRGPFQVGHRQDAAMVEGRNDSIQLCLLGAINEEDLAIADVSDVAKVPHDERMRINLLAVHGRLEMWPERIATQYANDEWLIRRPERARWPCHEVRKVKDEHGLHFIFGRSISAGRTERHWED